MIPKISIQAPRVNFDATPVADNGFSAAFIIDEFPRFEPEIEYPSIMTVC